MESRSEKKRKVLVLGDVVLIKTTVCDFIGAGVYRPVGEHVSAGMAGEVASTLSRQGDLVRLIAPIGDDQDAIDLIDALESADIQKLESTLIIQPGRKTRVTTMYRHRGGTALLELQEDGIDSVVFQQSLLDEITKYIQDADEVVLQDHGLGFFTEKLWTFLSGFKKPMHTSVDLLLRVKENV